MHGEQQCIRISKISHQQILQNTYTEDDRLEKERRTRNRMTMCFPLLEAMFPASSDTANFNEGRPAPEVTRGVELKKLFMFPKDSALPTPGRLTLVQIGTLQFALGQDMRRHTGCDETVDTRTSHQCAMPVSLVRAVVSPKIS